MSAREHTTLLRETTDFASLLYNRQFVAGPRPFRPSQSWREEKFGSHFYVTCHPNLTVTKASTSDKEILCLGHILDSDNPALDNKDILVNILSLAETFVDFEKQTWPLGGRWLIFVRIGDQVRLYPDAGGLRSAFYITRETSDELWIASQPRLLADAFGLKVDKGRVEQFFKSNFQNSWPGETTPYKGLYQLLPNHYLELASRQVNRFWPNGNILQFDVNMAAQVVRDILYNLLSSVARRAHMAMALTGGYDSRVLFNCAGDLRKHVTFFSIVDPGTPHYDISVPKALARQSGVKLHRVRTKPTDNLIKTIFKANTSDMYWDPTDFRAYSFGIYDKGWFVITGHAGEVARCFYYKDGVHPSVITPEVLSGVTGYHGNPIAMKSFAKWLLDVPRDTNINVLDLLYWEHRLGNWGAMMATGLDTVCEIIPPFNCRKVLEIALGADVLFRQKPYSLFRKICAIGDPKTVLLPFNTSKRDQIVGALKNLVPWRIREKTYWIRMKLVGLSAPR